jgi:hypothetical protein
MSDPDYADEVGFLRSALVHATTPRRLGVTIGPHGPSHTESIILGAVRNPRSITAHDLVVAARDLTDRHVRMAVDALCAGRW